MSSPVGVFISIVDERPSTYIGMPHSFAIIATPDVPILFAVSPFAATLTHPTNTASKLKLGSIKFSH